MKTSRKVLKNLFSLTIAEIANKGITFLWTIYLAQYLMPEGFGVISFANAIVIYLTIFSNLGFNVVGIREVSKDYNLTGKYVNNITTARLMFAAILYIGLFIFVQFFLDKSQESKNVVLIIGLTVFANALMLDWLFQAVERMEFLGLRYIITSALNLIGIYAFVKGPDDLIIAAVVCMSSMIINALWLVLVYSKLYGPLRFEIDFHFWKKLIKQGYIIAYTSLFNAVLNYLNVLMIGIIWNSHETGIFKAGFQVLIMAVTPSAIIQSAFFPLISRAESIEEKQKITNKYSLMIFLCGSIISVIGFVYSDAIVLVFGSKYSESVDVIRLIMIANFVVYVSTTMNPPLLAWKKEKQIMLIYTVGAIISAVLNYLFISSYGAPGAAVAEICSEFCVMIGLAVLFYQTIKKLFIGNLLKSLGFALVAGAIGYLLREIGVNVFVSASLCFGIYIALIFLFKTVTFSELKGYFARK